MNEVTEQIEDFDPSTSAVPDFTKIAKRRMDLLKLEAFCKKHGIKNLNPGNVDPAIVLEALKKQYGISDESATESHSPSQKQLICG